LGDKTASENSGRRKKSSSGTNPRALTSTLASVGALTWVDPWAVAGSGALAHATVATLSKALGKRLRIHAGTAYRAGFQ